LLVSVHRCCDGVGLRGALISLLTFVALPQLTAVGTIDLDGARTRTGCTATPAYTDGFGSDRPEMFAEAFHPLARIYWTTADGKFDENLIANAHDGWANLDDLAPVTARFISVIQAGELASVVLGFDSRDDPTQSWLDIHSLLRLDGTWKIMNKAATHASRADWAGLGASHSGGPQD
jgi:hypothetical protein